MPVSIAAFASIPDTAVEEGVNCQAQEAVPEILLWRTSLCFRTLSEGFLAGKFLDRRAGRNRKKKSGLFNRLAPGCAATRDTCWED